MSGKLLLTKFGVISLGCSVNGEARVFVRHLFYQSFVICSFLYILSSLTLLFVVSYAVKRQLKLKSRYRKCVEAAIEYAKIIDNFNDLVDPHTLALHCLGPEPFAYILCTIKIKEKKSKYLLSSSLSLPFPLFPPPTPFFFLNKCFPFARMIMKFNQGMYAKIRAKKKEPLSNLGKRVVRVMEKGVSVTPTTPIIETMRTASLGTSIEEITPLQKKQRVADNGKDKANSHSSRVWDDAGLALVRAQDAFTAEELRVFSSMSSNEVVGHIHKLV